MTDRLWRRLSGRPGPFPLTRWFLVLGFVAIFASSGMSAWFLSAFVKATWLHQDALITQQFVTSIVRARKAEQHFATGQPDIIVDELEGLFKEIALEPNVFRANFYGRNRVILWSSEEAFIGTTFASNPDLERALGGELIVEEGVVGEVRKAEQAFLDAPTRTFMEYYVPIDNDAGETIGVVEVYRSPEPLLDAIERSQVLVWSSALIVGAIIYFSLGWLVRRADLVIQQQTKELAESRATAAIGEISSAVAHGLRNPLAAIRTSAELAMHSNPPDESRAVFKEIIGLSDRLEHWIRDLLNTLRPDRPEDESCELELLVRDAVADYERQAQLHSVDVVIAEADEIPTVPGNATALRQVVGCLISNALEAMEHGGRLDIAVKPRPADGMVAIEIADSGAGPTEDRDPFEAFVTTKGAGLGVGLALARRIVERHGGALSLARRPAGGAIATISLPVEG